MTCAFCRQGQHDRCQDTMFTAIVCDCECDEIGTRNRITTGTRVRPLVPDMHGRDEGGTCKTCGCDIGQAVGSRARHEEWHETITQAMREQVEEAVAEALDQQRQHIEAVNERLTGQRHLPNDGHTHHWVDKSTLNEPQLYVCNDCGIIQPSGIMPVDPVSPVVDSKCAHCNHEKDLHFRRDGYQPYGRCNYGHDLCGCSRYDPKV